MLELDLRPDRIAPSRARTELRSLSSDLPQIVVDQLELLVTELVTNSIRHAEFMPGDEISIRISPQKGRVTVRVCDPGGKSVPHLVDDVELFDTGGRGLLLLDNVASRWGIERNARTCVWFELAVP